MITDWLTMRKTPGSDFHHCLANPVHILITAMFLVTLFLSGCATQPAPVPPAAAPTNTATTSTEAKEIPPQIIALEGLASSAQMEFSGMAWLEDTLILLPQYANRASASGKGALYAIPRQRLLDYIQGRDTQPIRPAEIAFDSAGVEKQMLIFEGFEAIAFHERRAYLTIEGRSGVNMMGYLVRGEVSADLSSLTLDASTLTENPPQARQQNRTDEAIVIAGNKILTFFESNGEIANPGAYASQFDMDFKPLEPIDLPALEYRLTDATAMDGQGNFWVMNYFYPGDTDLFIENEPLAELFGMGATHSQADGVERLVQFNYTHDAITLTSVPPIQLELDLEAGSRNWEGLAMLEDLGFLLITDKFPTTMLGFLPYP